MTDSMLFLVLGIAIGAVLGFLIAKLLPSKRNESDEQAEQGLALELQQLRVVHENLIRESSAQEGRIEQSLVVFKEQRDKLREQEDLIIGLTGNVERLTAEKQAMEDKLRVQVEELENYSTRFKAEFKQLANEILKQNSKDFNEVNQKQIGDILNPLRERIERFEKKVNEVYDTENKSRSELMGQVKSLMELNKKISEDATNLTKALKGDTQKQGAWGEFILESILENSGLEKGVEYETQVSNRTEDGLFRPDVIVYLPDEKFIIIDSKVSLKAYDDSVNAETDEDRTRYLQQHVLSIKQHIKGLSAKNYQLKAGRQSLDFVLMFVPIEPGFTEALKFDRELFNFAWDNRIVLVSPTTLLATLRTVASVWKQEKQNRNVIEIAEESGKLYDKFMLFLQDLERIKKGIDQSQAAYDGALNKLQTGSGNLIRRAERIRALGAKTSKEIPNSFLNQTAAEE